MSFFRNESASLLETYPERDERKEALVKNLQVSWFEMRIVVPLCNTLITAAILSAALAFIAANWYGRDFLTVMGDSILFLLLACWIIYSGAALRVLWFLEWLFHKDLNRDGSTGKPLLIDPYRGQQNRERALIEEQRSRFARFVRYIAQGPQYCTDRVLNREFGYNWKRMKLALYDAGWIMEDYPGRTNTTWHLIEDDPDLVLEGLFATENKLRLKARKQDGGKALVAVDLTALDRGGDSGPLDVLGSRR